jgi:hypothetical protein
MTLPDITPVNQVWTIPMYERVEGKSVPPGRGEVSDPHARVLGCGAPCPTEQGFAGRHVRLLPHHDVGYLELNDLVRQQSSTAKIVYSIIMITVMKGDDDRSSRPVRTQKLSNIHR